jgi:ATP-dependent Clp protease adaptor protein ClpS
MPFTLSQDLVDSLQRATNVAERQNRKFAVPADLLIALIDDPDAAGIMDALRVNSERLRRDLVAHMQSAVDKTDNAVTPYPDGPRQTPEVQRLLQQAIAGVVTAGRDIVTGADVLIMLFTEPAGDFLMQQGATRYDATRYVSHGIRKNDPPPPGRADAEPSGATPLPGLLARVRLVNDNYTPMEFVVGVLERIFDMEHEAAVRLMLEVHQSGAAVCGVYPQDVAQMKVTEVLDFAREHQHPLHCVLETSASA